MIKTLIVEDNHDFMGLLKGLLSGRFPDILIVEAENGADALRAFTRFQPDVAFIDINLPGGMNGLGLIERIRRENSRIRIIIITNHDLPEYRDASVRLGADHFLPKASTTGDDILAVMESVTSTLGGSAPGH
jgi:two-component system nitrate/nitrite response regulator NarL